MSLEILNAKLATLISQATQLRAEAGNLHAGYVATVVVNNSHLEKLRNLKSEFRSKPTEELKAEIASLETGEPFCPGVLNIRNMFASERLWQAKEKELSAVRDEIAKVNEAIKEAKVAAWKAKTP